MVYNHSPVNPHWNWQFQSLIILLVLGAFLFGASSSTLSLLALDDCFYARKGIETARSGRFFTVTWNHHPTFQNPPLQIWILGKSFQIFGENDFAARLPSILMALGILVFTYLIGSNIASPTVGIIGVALLFLTPHFVSNSKRCMLEIPNTFWICFTIWIFLKGQRLPKLHLSFALPLGAAILTKSVLGFLPVLLIGITAVFNTEVRKSLKQGWLWIGFAAGVLIGAAWPINQFEIFGMEALKEHYFGEIFSRSAKLTSISKLIFGYPLILLTVFQPIVLPALPGFVKIFRERKTTSFGMIFLLIWIAIPVILYSFSAARSSRYIFPILPALALVGGYWLQSKFPKGSEIFVRVAAPIILIVTSALFWIAPSAALKDENKSLKLQHSQVSNVISETEPLPYLGNRYWSVANPLMYYSERQLRTATDSVEDVIRVARNGSGYIVADSDRVDSIQRVAPCEVVFAEEKWKLLRLL